MPWKRYILRDFRRMVPKNPSRFDFFGPYINIMYSLFPDPDYTVATRFKSGRQPPPDYAQVDILFKYKPVLMLDLNVPGDLRHSSKRQEAIQTIQQRIKVLRRQCYIITIFMARDANCL